jgi:hypothetical protein
MKAITKVINMDQLGYADVSLNLPEYQFTNASHLRELRQVCFPSCLFLIPSIDRDLPPQRIGSVVSTRSPKGVMGRIPS